VEGFSGHEVKKRTDVKPLAKSYIKKRARDRGFTLKKILLFFIIMWRIENALAGPKELHLK
jgi:hypothetical protein